MNSIRAITALGDNYIYLCPSGENSAFVVDPGTATPVLRVLESERLKLRAILATHRHGDHNGGIRELKAETACQVIAPENRRIPLVDRVVIDGDIVKLDGAQIEVLATPGHTRTSVSYYTHPRDVKPGAVFTGDTLFIGGCGRIIECDAETMWQSLQKIAALPDDTLVYPGHDYTEENFEFALTIEPDNDTLKERLAQIRQAQKTGRPTVPSTIAREKSTNIFLRSGTTEIKNALGMANATTAEVFAELRRRKDIFG